MNNSTKILFLLLALVTTANAKLSIELDSAVVPIGQTFRLTLTDDNPSTRRRPDLAPLQQNFTLVGTQHMANYTVINGQAHSLNQWVLLLTPKRTGVLKIPPIAIGQEKTAESQIEVTTDGNSTAASEQQGDKVQAVKFVTEVSDPKPYVNQEVVYTVKLYISRRLLDADYQPPQVKDALMVSLGQPNRYQTVEKGISYTVEELQYAFFPQKSGLLKITPPQFHALVFDAIPGNVQITAKTTSLNVQPVPILNQKVSWLPAKQVSLQESYDNQSKSIDEGSMIVRTITLSAKGAAAQILPRLTFETNNQFSVYPETPTEETHYQKPDLLGTTVIKVTYLFNKSGSIVIPKLKLPWFNTVSCQPAEAFLPARTIRVSPVTTATTGAPAAPIKISPTQTTDKSIVPVQSSLPQSMVQYRLAWFVAAGFALAWFVTLLLWWWTRIPRAGNAVREARKRVRLACRRHDPIAAKEALIDWASKIGPEVPCFNLADVATLVGSPSLKKAINALSQQLYQDKQQEWQGTELGRSFALYKPEKGRRSKKEKNHLPPINP
ncbi:MAG: hypothetical protein A3F46_03490 [Legionellales bacterium RIFCSPHIGHO2_12_FULL_42_9]|nr:MAG: hypothetical protein A3F46_03490 [Legionellales bacterium RIFCSPHIGHO2_12_FULL_42_9]